jgi:hypothetical protein
MRSGDAIPGDGQRFADHLRRLAEPIWAAQHAHPFVRGIGDGTLDLERFVLWELVYTLAAWPS